MPQSNTMTLLPTQATAGSQQRLDRLFEIVAHEPQWRVRPTKDAPVAKDARVVATRWRRSQQNVHDASAATPDDCHVIGIPLRSMKVRLSVDGRDVVDGAVMPGTPLVTAPGTRANCRFRGPGDELHLYAPLSLIAECADDLTGCTAELGPRAAPIRDSMVERLGWAMLAADEIGGPVGQLYADCIGTAIVARLVNLASGTAATVGTKLSALPRWRLKRAIDYVESHLDEPVSLAQLATAAGLSRMHFAAQFRTATGLRPHEYLLRRRIERAQDMLAGADMPIVEIALSVGFQAQSHFTTVFKRFTGQSPLAWRQTQGGRGLSFEQAHAA